ncbi:molybdopterin molybdotransferase MoeA [Rubricella aquisinus]|nr:gephyrin-like molybdotransferase Glp [Rubricella aquisinus]
MISVAEAFTHLEALIPCMEHETVPLRAAHGRVLAADVTAQRAQPPFDGSAMDGYAMRSADARPGATAKVIGESQAGSRFAGRVGAGEAVRIFTGAPVPEGTDRIVLQEDVDRDGDQITLRDSLDQGPHIRRKGIDFDIGSILTAPRVITPRLIGLLGAMNVAHVTVARRPVIGLIATGDELVMPGETPGPDQIVSSNSLALAALIEAAGAVPRILPIARDTRDSTIAALKLAQDCDMVVTIGGASVGDHDLVASSGKEIGLTLDFYKIAMRPGKPLMAGRLNNTPMLGLPGNPVSAMICAELFLIPLIHASLGLPFAPRDRQTAKLGAALPANGPREHYMRARLTGTTVSPMSNQDSSLLSILSEANALIVRPPHDPAQPAGAPVQIIGL